MISFTQSRFNNHKPGMAHVFATPGGQSFLHLEVLSTILLWRCRHLRIPQLDKNSTTPPSPTDPTIDSIEPRKIAERRFWIWMQSQLIFNYNGIYQPCSINDGGKATIAVERHGKMSQHAPAMDCSAAPTPDLTDHPCTKKCPVPKDVRYCAHSQTCCPNKRQSLHKGPHCGSKAFQMNWCHKI